MKDNNQIQFKANNNLLFTVKEQELDLNNMTVKYLGQEEYNFQSDITHLIFFDPQPIKVIDCYLDGKKIKEVVVQNPKQIKIVNFICDICDKSKVCQLHRERVNGLGIDPMKVSKVCDGCIKWVDVINDKHPLNNKF